MVSHFSTLINNLFKNLYNFRQPNYYVSELGDGNNLSKKHALSEDKQGQITEPTPKVHMQVWSHTSEQRLIKEHMSSQPNLAQVKTQQGYTLGNKNKNISKDTSVQVV